MSSSSDSSAFQALQAENARLVALLEAHGIEWRQELHIAARQPA
jgi:hypothetical protein